MNLYSILWCFRNFGSVDWPGTVKYFMKNLKSHLCDSYKQYNRPLWSSVVTLHIRLLDGGSVTLVFWSIVTSPNLELRIKLASAGDVIKIKILIFSLIIQFNVVVVVCSFFCGLICKSFRVTVHIYCVFPSFLSFIKEKGYFKFHKQI